MKIITQRGLNARMLLSIGSAVFLGLAVLTTLVTLRAMRSAKEEAFALSRKTAADLSSRMETRLGAALGTARSVAQAFEGVLAAGHPSRTEADAILRGTLAGFA